MCVDAFINTLPVQFRGSYLLRASTILNRVMKLFKTFVSEKVASRIVDHGSDVKSLYEVVDKRILPTEMGGDAGSCDELSAHWAEHVVRNKQYLEKFRDCATTKL